MAKATPAGKKAPAKKWSSDKTPEQLSSERKEKVDEIMKSAAEKLFAFISDPDSQKKWKKTWSSSADSVSPINFGSGNRFSGFNRILLMMEMFNRIGDGESQGIDNRFMTFAQAIEYGKKNNVECSVKKGEKGIYVLKPITFEKENERDESAEDGVLESKKRVFFKPYAIFHASQISGLPVLESGDVLEWEKDPTIENLVNLSGATVVHGGDRASYNRSTDRIHMPNRSDFESVTEYYATKLHEWYHWTGGENREGRTFGTSFGDELYAAEEVRAEAFSVISGMALGLPLAVDNHAAYLEHWAKKLESADGIKEITSGMREACAMLDVVLDVKAGSVPSVSWWPKQQDQDHSASNAADISVEQGWEEEEEEAFSPS